jgi:hypothetical protein
MTDDEQHGQLDLVAAQVNRLASEAYAGLRAHLAGGATPREAVRAALRQFRGPYYDILAEAFSKILRRAVGTSEVKRWPVGGITLSSALYRHHRRVETAAISVIKAHQQATETARSIALELYEGYGFKPREVLDIRAALPKYIRRETLLSSAYERTISRFKASNLKTPALKAAYLQAIDAIEAGVGDTAIDRRLRVAFEERNRYLANRIAQTELQRAYARQKDGAMLADSGIEFVRWELSRTHPQEDICDLHASIDKYGLGPGVYPKHLAPARPAHPFCRCIIRPMFAIEGSSWRERPGAERAYLRGLTEREAARVIGSRAKLQQILDGEGLASVLNRGVPEGYRFARLGDALASNAPWAKQGAKFNGFWRVHKDLSVQELERSIKSSRRQISRHESWIRNPESKIPGFSTLDERRQRALIERRWPADIERHRMQIRIVEEILRQRKP